MRSTIWDDFKRYVLHSGNWLNKLVAINIAVFVVTGLIWVMDRLFATNILLFGQIEEFLGFPSVALKALYHPWTIITYQFMHAGLLHLVFNMFMFIVAGRIFREFLGDKKLLNLYLMGGIAGALMFLLAMNIFPLFKADTPYIIGASASIMAILTGAATLVPNYTIFVVLIGPIRLVYVMLIFFVLDLLSLAGGNAGGHFSHVGGALFGYVYIKSLQNGTDLGGWLTSFFAWCQNLFKPKSNIRVNYRGPEPPRPKHHVSQEEVDAILDKIAKSGYDSLTQREKDILFRASKDN